MVITQRQFGEVCAGVGSCLYLRYATLNTAVGWGNALGVERTFAWLNQFRRLRVRFEKRADIHEAFLSLGCILICWRPLATL